MRQHRHRDPDCAAARAGGQRRAYRGDDVPSIWSGAIFAGILQSLVLIPLGLILLPLLLYQYDSSIIAIGLLFLLFIPLNLLTVYQNSIFQGRLQMRTFNIVRFLVTGVYLVCLVYLWALGKFTVRNCTISILLANLTVLIYQLIILWKIGWIHWKYQWILLKKMLRYGLRAQLGNVSSLLNLRLDQMAMSVLIAPAMLGFYVVGVTYSNGVNIISNAIAAVSFPSISRTNDLNIQRDLIERFFRLNLWGCCLAGLFLGVMAAWLIPLLFGQNYQPAVTAAIILVIAGVVAGLNTLMASVLKGVGKPIVSSYGEVISLIATVTFLILLLPRWNIIGAAVTSLIAYSITSIYLFVFLYKKYSFPIGKLILPQRDDFVTAKKALMRARQAASSY
jgi:O-antigen/teichoic acid export membrane protein